VCWQAMAAWKLLGEYTGVWDNHETVSQRINDDPIGLGTMRRDKVTEFASTSKDANEEAQKGMPLQTSQFSFGFTLLAVVASYGRVDPARL